MKNLYEKIEFIHENIDENDVEFEIEFDNYESYGLSFKNDDDIIEILVTKQFDLLDMKINDEFVDIEKLNDVAIEYIKIIDNTILKFNIEKFENDVTKIFDELNVEIDDEIIYDVEKNVATIYSISLIKNMLIDNPEIKKMNDEIDVVVATLKEKINEIDVVENVEIIDEFVEIEIDEKFHDEIIELNELYDDMKIYF